MTQPRSTSTPVDALGATIANQSARAAALENVAHRHPSLFGRGVVAAARVSSGSEITGITTTPVDIPSLGVQFIADPSRLYRVTITATIGTNVANDVALLRLATSTGVALQNAAVHLSTANFGETTHLRYLLTGSGAQNLKAQVVRAAGSGSLYVVRSDPSFNPMIVVEDISGLPSPYLVVGGSSSDTITTIGGTIYRLITLTSNGSLEIINGDLLNVDYVVVGGGGGGGGAGPNQGLGAGGGAGSFKTGQIPLVTSGAYSFTIGTGGAGTTGSAGAGSNGGDTSGFGITAIGGGGGGQWWNAARVGASGGGGGNQTGVTTTGANGITGEGNKGGNGANYSGAPGATSCGGGGGAGGVGGNGSGGTGGAGGAGMTSTIIGSTGTFCQGGGGGGTAAGGTGGTTGGFGGTGNSDGGAAAANTGSGGGGASDLNVGNKTGGRGADGVIILRFPYPQFPFQQ